MNTIQIKEYEDSMESALQSILTTLRKETFVQSQIRPLLPQLSDSCHLMFGDGYTWITVHTREDLEILLTLAPKWTKSTEGESMIYRADLKLGSIRINAINAAIPPTCQVIEEEVTEPARPARTYKRSVIKCNLKPLTAVDGTSGETPPLAYNA